ncbi:hypothetical protein HMPREF0518_0069 [Lactobacillus helveticus DSM 20075 = CGMCC 1.1877]|nr:hypothetical protein HMPREF0518_0069 [Lactobacillus helveticus DSM 20075 = CGMCC 1.1877]
MHATTKAERVLVEDFSNKRAIFFPFKYSCGIFSLVPSNEVQNQLDS